ncbi:MAG: hypothetical protein KatS3mg023_3711 [Armatimonadota bacterium]|nr:MAG: hypothetical protein KatS3mg023_3711 [Armatimonadota bacterium]
MRRSAVSLDQWRVVDRFDTSYYNGLDVRVMLGDFVLSEVVGMSYELMEQAMPLYGYSSYTYDRIVRGTRIIRGQFTINFKQSGYIVWLVQRYMMSFSGEAFGQRRLNTAISGLRNGESNLPALREDIRRAVQRQVRGESRELADVVQAIRTHFWGEPSADDDLSTSNRPLFVRGNVPLRLFIAYGDPQLKDSRGVFLQRPVDTVDGTPVMNVPVTQRAELFQAEELVDVQILGYSKAIDDSGRNLLEQYQFMARDILFWQR